MLEGRKVPQKVNLQVFRSRSYPSLSIPASMFVGCPSISACRLRDGVFFPRGSKINGNTVIIIEPTDRFLLQLYSMTQMRQNICSAIVAKGVGLEEKAFYAE